MADTTEIIEAVYCAIDELNQTLPAKERVAKLPDAKLFGPQGTLSSLGLINLVVETEQQIEETFGILVNLGDLDSMSPDENPFEDVTTLVNYISSILHNEAKA